MALDPRVTQRFLKRKLANSDKAKRFSLGALDRKLAALNPPPRVRLPMLRHQKISFLLAAKYGSYFPILGVGLGKTKLMLDLFSWRKRRKDSKRLLVLVPGIGNVGGWEAEVEKHAPHLRFTGIDDRVLGAEREEALKHPGDIVVMTYQGWANAVCVTVEKRGRNGKTTREWTVDPKKAKKLERLFDEVCFDESHLLKNHMGLYFRAARRLSSVCRYRTCLTGTPFSRDPASLWSQFFVVDRGQTLGHSIGLMRAALFKQVKNYWSRGHDYKFDESKWETLHRMMKHRSVRFSEDECLDLPKSLGGYVDPIIRQCMLPKKTWTYYERLVEELRAAQGDIRLMDNAYARMRQLCSGWLPVKDGVGGRHEIVFPTNPKLDLLVAELEAIPEDDKVIVACEYVKTGDLIAERLKKLKVKHLRLYGQTTGKGRVIKSFREDPSIRVLVASKAGSTGHNLQAASWIIFFESPNDPASRKQFEGRIRRTGQKKRPHYIDLHVIGGIEGPILESLRTGADLLDLVVEGADKGR